MYQWTGVAGFNQGSQKRLVSLSLKIFLVRRCSKACDSHRCLSEATRFVSRLAPWSVARISNIMEGCAVQCGSFIAAMNI